MKDTPWVSWNENIKHQFDQQYSITTEAEFAEAIKKAKNVRYYGSKQSSSDIAAGTATLINTEAYNQILNIDATNKLITVQSGIKLKELIEAVEALNWCIPCLPDINTVSIGGALATGTHGTSGQLLASYVVECRLILSDGTIKTINERDEIMDAVRVSIGMLGAFSTLTIQCVENYTLHIKEGPEKDEQWLEQLPSYLKKHDFLRILWLPHTGRGYVIKGDIIDADKEVIVEEGPSYLKYRRKASKILYKYSHRFPWTTYIANNLLYLAFFRSKKEHKGSLYQSTVTKSRGSTLELAEWTVSLEKFPEVFKELKATINDWANDSFIHIPMDIRFVNKDNSWLSYAYDQTTVTMGCVSRNASTANSYEAFKTIETIFLKYNGRPHWGKRFMAKDDQLARLYPKWNDFKSLRRLMDPTNKFLNSYLRTLLGEKPANT